MVRNWVRWFRASVNKHFADRITYPLVYTGIPLNPNQFPRVEIRFNGPTFRETTRGQWLLDTMISLLCTCDTALDIYTLDRMLGECAEAASTDICIKTHGELEVLPYAVMQRDSPLTVAYHGQVDETINIHQGTVNARFKTILGTSNGSD